MVSTTPPVHTPERGANGDGGQAVEGGEVFERADDILPHYGKERYADESSFKCVLLWKVLRVHSYSPVSCRFQDESSRPSLPQF